MKRLRLGGLILLCTPFLVLGACSGSGGGSATSSSFVAFEPFSQKVPVGNHTQLKVVGVNGVIKIQGRPAASSVSVSAVIVTSAAPEKSTASVSAPGGV